MCFDLLLHAHRAFPATAGCLEHAHNPVAAQFTVVESFLHLLILHYVVTLLTSGSVRCLFLMQIRRTCGAASCTSRSGCGWRSRRPLPQQQHCTSMVGPLPFTKQSARVRLRLAIVGARGRALRHGLGLVPKHMKKHTNDWAFDWSAHHRH